MSPDKALLLTKASIISMIATTSIALLAFIISICALKRDRRNRQADMLLQIISSIRNLNRIIAETMPEEKKQEQINAFRTELKNEYEFLAFLVNQKQIEGKNVYALEGEFLTKLVKKAGVKRNDCPETYKLLDSWKKEGKIKKEDYEQ